MLPQKMRETKKKKKCQTPKRTEKISREWIAEPYATWRFRSDGDQINGQVAAVATIRTWQRRNRGGGNTGLPGEEPGGLRVAAMAAYEEKTRARRRGEEEDRKTQDTHRRSLARLLRESNRWPIASWINFFITGCGCIIRCIFFCCFFWR